MKFSEFENEINKIYNGKFQKSCCRCRLIKRFGCGIFIDCYLSENDRECLYGIRENDLMTVGFMIELPDDFDINNDLPENMVMKSITNHIKTKSECHDLYCSYKKPAYRKTTGNAKKIITAFEKYVDRLYTLVKNEYENKNLLNFDMALIEHKKYFRGNAA